MKNRDTLKLGSTIKLKNFEDITGKIVKINNQKATIQSNNIFLEVLLDDIELIEFEELNKNESKIPKNNIKPINLNIEEINNFKSEIDLHGLYLSEAFEILDRFIDKAQILGHKYLKIIHGKGKGTLRTEIRKSLNKDPRIQEVMINNILFKGGSGVTWIEIK